MKKNKRRELKETYLMFHLLLFVLCLMFTILSFILEEGTDGIFFPWIFIGMVIFALWEIAVNDILPLRVFIGRFDLLMVILSVVLAFQLDTFLFVVFAVIWSYDMIIKIQYPFGFRDDKEKVKKD